MTKEGIGSRATIKTATIKRLFARSMNQCAFRNCNAPIVDVASGAMVGEMCHIEGVGKTALRHNTSLSPAQRDSYDNLILLCSNHHKIIDKDAVTYTVEALKRMKAEHEQIGRMEILPEDDCYARICMGNMEKPKTATATTRRKSSRNSVGGIMKDIGIAVVGNNNNVTNITNNKVVRRVVKQYPNGTIGSDANKGNYVSYLIEKYHRCKEWEIGKDKMNYAIFPSRIKSKFKIGQNRKCNHIPLARFDEVICFIQENIKRTKMFRVGLMSYKDYDSWLEEQNGSRR